MKVSLLENVKPAEEWIEENVLCEIDFAEAPRQNDIIEVDGHGLFLVTGRRWICAGQLDLTARFCNVYVLRLEDESDPDRLEPAE